MKRKEVAKIIREALLQKGKMAYDLYEYELEEHVDTWYEGLKADKDEFVFAVTENRGHVAMVLIEKDKTIYMNDEAKEKLKEYWPKTYRTNLKTLIPLMANELANGMLSINGVKIEKK